MNEIIIPDDQKSRMEYGTTTTFLTEKLKLVGSGKFRIPVGSGGLFP